jgi:hypothetical protein
MEQHRERKNQMDWPHLETQRILEEYSRRKNRGRSLKSITKGQIHGTNKEESTLQKHQEVSQLVLDRVGWRAAVNQS